MATTTPNFGWPVPTSTDLVKDGATAIEALGDGVDASLVDLKGGTTGQILAKATNADMDFVWIANDQGDITEVAVTSPLTVSAGTGPVATVGILSGTTSNLGAVQLSTSTSSTSTSLAATPSAVKSAFDLASAAIPKLLAFNAQTGTTYTLIASDADKLVTTSNAAAVTVTIPPSVFSTGQQINVQSIGVGLTSFAQGAGVTITSTGATSTAPILRARYSAATIICTASNTFTVIGDLS
jgi:hypothetical protein